MVLSNQLDIVIIDKQEKNMVEVDVAIPSDGNIRKKEHKKLEKYQRLKDELESMSSVDVVPMVTPMLGEELQQIQGTTMSAFSSQ